MVLFTPLESGGKSKDILEAFGVLSVQCSAASQHPFAQPVGVAIGCQFAKGIQ
jgi:hypothetical protein